MPYLYCKCADNLAIPCRLQQPLIWGCFPDTSSLAGFSPLLQQSAASRASSCSPWLQSTSARQAIPMTSTMWAELVCARNPWAALAPSEMTAKALQADCWEGVPLLSLRLFFLFQIFSVWVQNWHKLGMWFLSLASFLSRGAALRLCYSTPAAHHGGCSPHSSLCTESLQGVQPDLSWWCNFPSAF